MIVRINERTDRVLKRYNRGVRDKLTLELFQSIEEYRAATEKRVTDYICEYIKQAHSVEIVDPVNARRDFMIWTECHVEKSVRSYVRGEYSQIQEILCGYKSFDQFQLTVDVLKRTAVQYKTLADIGIPIETAETHHREWLSGWDDYAVRMKSLPAIYETHAHYNMDQYDLCRDRLLKEMHEAGIEKCIVPSVEAYRRDGQGNPVNCNRQMIETLDGYDWIYFGIGTHPKYLWKDSEWCDTRWEEFEQLLTAPRCVAVGETGVDYSYPSFCEAHRILQERFFIRSINLANKYHLPVILHVRPAINLFTGEADPAAIEDALRILKEHPVKNGAVCHCFDGHWRQAQRYIECGVTYFGIGGKILSNKASLIEAVEQLPEKCLVLETDAPYINTTGISGPNTSYALVRIAEKIAEIRGTTIERVIESSYENAECLFGRQWCRKKASCKQRNS